MNELWYLLDLSKDDDNDIQKSLKFFSSEDKAIAYKNALVAEVKDDYEDQHYYLEVHEYNRGAVTEFTVYYPGSDDVKFEDHFTIGKVIPEE